MGGERSDLTGRTFGRLTVIEREADKEAAKRADRHSHWVCLCECGSKDVVVRGTKLTGGLILSCGCWRADPAVRQAARMQTTKRRRREIASMGAEARWAD